MPKEHGPGVAERMVLEYMRADALRSMAVGDIARDLGLQPATVSHVVNRRTDVIEKRRRGWYQYRVTTEPRKTAKKAEDYVLLRIIGSTDDNTRVVQDEDTREVFFLKKVT